MEEDWERTRRMEQLIGELDFEWDDKKAAANRRKHKVSFEEAATVFGDRMAYMVADPDH